MYLCQLVAATYGFTGCSSVNCMFSNDDKQQHDVRQTICDRTYGGASHLKTYDVPTL